MHESNQTFAYAHFGDERAAVAAVEKLIEQEFDSEHIGIIMRDHSGVQDASLDHKTGIVPGAALGSVLGAAVGAAALPVTGVIALGGAFATLGGAAVGGAGGTLLGVLGGLGVWKDKPSIPHATFEQGGVLVGTLTPPERADQAQAALKAAGARETKLATPLVAKRELQAMHVAPQARAARTIEPDRLARNIFVLLVAYVLAVAASIWLFIRPV